MRDEFKNPITKAVHLLVEGICNHRSSLRFEVAESDACLAITIYPHASDAPMLVGKQGRTIKALEWLAERAGDLARKKCFLSMEDSFTGKSEGWKEFVARSDFDFETLKRMLATWNGLVFDCPVGMEFTRENGEIKVYLNPARLSDDNVTVIRALDSLFYQYGMSNGCVVKIKPMKNGD